MVRFIFVYGLQSGRMVQRKSVFYDDLRSKWDLHQQVSQYWVWVILMDMLVNGLRVLRVCMEETELGREMWMERCCQNFVTKRVVCEKNMAQKKGEEENDRQHMGKWNKD